MTRILNPTTVGTRTAPGTDWSSLKDHVLPVWQLQLNYKADPLWAQLERDVHSFSGRQIDMALRHGKRGGIMFGSETSDLPAPRPRKTTRALWDAKNLYAPLQFSVKMLKAARNRDGAFAEWAAIEFEDVSVDAKDQISRAVYGEPSGKIAEITAASWSNGVLTLTLDKNVNMLMDGQFIDVIDESADPDAVLTNGERLEILTVDEATKIITVSCANNISGNIVTTPGSRDYIVMSGCLGHELTGLNHVFTPDTVIYNIDRSQNKWMNPISIAVNGTLQSNNLQKALDEAERRAGSQASALVSNFGVRRAYQIFLESTKQTVNSLELKGGWKTLSYTGGNGPIGFIAAKYAPANTLYALDLDDWKVYQLSDWDWMDDDGAILHRVSGKPYYEATLIWMGDIGCSKIGGQVVLTGIVEM